jgi:hypothetical protein
MNISFLGVNCHLSVNLRGFAKFIGVSFELAQITVLIRRMEGEEQIPEMSLMPLRHQCSMRTSHAGSPV